MASVCKTDWDQFDSDTNLIDVVDNRFATWQYRFVMEAKRYEELKKIAQTVMRAWNGGTSFNDAYWNTPFGQYILTELEKAMYPVVPPETKGQ